MSEIKHDFNIGDIVYAIFDDGTKSKIEKYVVSGVIFVPRFSYPQENSKELFKDRTPNYNLYHLDENVIPPTPDSTPSCPGGITKYFVNPLNKERTISANRVYGSIDDLVTELKETAE